MAAPLTARTAADADLVVENVVKEYPTPGEPLRILDGVSLALDALLAESDTHFRRTAPRERSPRDSKVAWLAGRRA